MRRPCGPMPCPFAGLSDLPRYRTPGSNTWAWLFLTLVFIRRFSIARRACRLKTYDSVGVGTREAGPGNAGLQPSELPRHSEGAGGNIRRSGDRGPRLGSTMALLTVDRRH